MSTLISQFSGACGLRFRNKETGAMRGVRVNNDLFLPPNGAMGWPTDVTFNVVYRFIYNCYRLSVRGAMSLKFFSVKIMQPIAKKGKSLIKIPKLNLPNHNHRKERHKNLPTWPFSGLILARGPRTYSFFQYSLEDD